MIDTKKIRNKHGFTLVEIIVVLVILAILAAVAIPSVLGFMKQRKLLLQNAMQQMKMNLKNNQFLNITTHYLQIFLIKRQQQIQLEECLIL